VSARLSLFGEIFTPQQAFELGVVNELRPAAEVLDPLDDELPDGMTHEQSRLAHRRYWQHLKGAPAPW
jgi:enoyl-CoA hydratase/carnithine racemase